MEAPEEPPVAAAYRLRDDALGILYEWDTLVERLGEELPRTRMQWPDTVD